MNEITRPQGAQAVLRAIGLLKSFSVQRPERTLNQLCKEMNLTRTTTHRLLAALVSEGLLERNGSTYRLGSTALALGTIATENLDLRAWVRPMLETLAEETGETATLEVLVDGEMMILDEVSAKSIMAPAGNIGTRWPLHATATGKMVMANEPGVKKQLAQELARYTDVTCTSHAELDTELARVREQGFASACDELEESYTALAVPIPGNIPVSNAALSVGGPSERMKRKGFETLVQFMRNAGQNVEMNTGIRAKAI